MSATFHAAYEPLRRLSYGFGPQMVLQGRLRTLQLVCDLVAGWDKRLVKKAEEVVDARLEAHTAGTKYMLGIGKLPEDEVAELRRRSEELKTASHTEFDYKCKHLILRADEEGLLEDEELVADLRRKMVEFELFVWGIQNVNASFRPNLSRGGGNSNWGFFGRYHRELYYLVDSAPLKGRFW